MVRCGGYMPVHRQWHALSVHRTTGVCINQPDLLSTVFSTQQTNRDYSMIHKHIGNWM